MNSIPLICYNCGQVNHTSKSCKNPIYSFGIIAMKLNNKEEYNKLLLYKNTEIIDLQTYTKNAEILMIQRNHSYCFLWFIKGINENNQNFEFLKPIWERMTEKEQDIIKHTDPKNFKDIWKMIWKTKSNKIYKKNDYTLALESFISFSNKTALKERLYKIPSICKHLEWGFPKGRRLRNKKYLKQETNLECAQREFHEETNYSEEDYIILNDSKTYKEIFVGTDGVKYAHEYYLALINWDNNKIPCITSTNYEVNKIQWLSNLNDINIYQSSRNEIIYQIWKLKNQNKHFI